MGETVGDVATVQLDYKERFGRGVLLYLHLDLILNPENRAPMYQKQ